MKDKDALLDECTNEYEKEANKIFSRIYSKHAKNLLTEFKSSIK